MSNVFNEYPVNGVGPYTITFEYQEQADVVVLYRNPINERYDVQSNTDWSFENATTIKLNEAPSSDYDRVRIQRSTDVNPLRAIFYPGSAIRAQDLNANFEQLMMAIEEEQQSLTDTSDYIDQFFWNKLEDTVKEEDQTSGKVITDNLIDDDYIFTTGAAAARHDAYVGDVRPAVVTSEQKGKIWNDTSALQDYFWDADNETWVSFTKSGPPGVKGDKGDQGDPGPQGDDGETPEFSIGDVTASDPGSDPEVTQTGTTLQPVLNFVLPRGEEGPQGPPGDGGGEILTFTAPLVKTGTNVSLDLLTIPNTP